MSTKKLTFAETQAEVQAAKNNSDLQNLAHAIEVLGVRRIELDELEKEILDTAAQIENGKVFTVDKIKDLHERAHGRGSKNHL